MSTGFGERLTLMNGCVPTIPFREFVGLAARTGYQSISLWPNVWRHACRREGLGLADLRSMLTDHDLTLTDVEICREWTGRAPGPSGGPQADREELFKVCVALGGTTITAVHDTADGVVLDRDATAFAQLCDDAADHGIRVALEFVPFSTVPDVGTAWSIVEAAGRPNGGLVIDVWHHVRSGASDEDLRQVPASRIFTVQLADGPRLPPGPDLAEEARTGRVAPGLGEMEVGRLVDLVAGMGVRATVGPELWLRDGPGLEDRVADVRAATHRLVAGSARR